MHSTTVTRMGTLDRFIWQYLGERRRRGEISKETQRGLQTSLSSLSVSFGARPLSQFSKRAIERWLETIGHLAPATRRGRLSAVRGFSRWMVDRGSLPVDPTERIPSIRQPRAVPRALPEADVARLLAVAPDQRARAIMWLMVGCGLRCVEVARLRVSDFDPVAGTITVTGKGGHERILPVPQQVRLELDRYLNQVGIVAGPLIRSERFPSRGLRPPSIGTYVSRWMRDAGIKHGRYDGRSAHALRHTCASDVLDGGADLRIVQELLGHQHLSSTSIYLRRASVAQLREAMEGRTYSGQPHLPDAA